MTGRDGLPGPPGTPGRDGLDGTIMDRKETRETKRIQDGQVDTKGNKEDNGQIRPQGPPDSQERPGPKGPAGVLWKPKDPVNHQNIQEVPMPVHVHVYHNINEHTSLYIELCVARN